VHASVIAVAMFTPFVISRFAADVAGMANTRSGGVVPSVTEAEATSKTWMYATVAFGL
jgi:hypothetical protein